MRSLKENYTEERVIKPFVNSVNQDWPGFGVSVGRGGGGAESELFVHVCHQGSLTAAR